MKKTILEIVSENNNPYVPALGEKVPENAEVNVWRKLIKTSPRVSKTGNVEKYMAPRKLKQNYAFILEHDTKYSSLCYHDHADRMLWQNEEIKEQHYEEIALDIEVRYWLSVPAEHLRAAIVRVANMRQITPIKDFLEKELPVWDEEKRLETLAENVFKAEITKETKNLIETMSRKMWIGYVARILDPGCKNDVMTILIGPKGTGKSTSMEIMAGSKWFSNSHIEIGNKGALELIHQSGVWIWELAELKSLQGKTSDTAKQFFSATEDRFRASYARFPSRRKRRVCFFGSTNNYQILDDGPERRFWIFKNTGPIDLEYLKTNRLQIWAEALHLYRTEKEDWWLPHNFELELQAYQQSFIINDPWTFSVAQKLRDLVTTERTSHKILEEMEIPIQQRNIYTVRRLNQICRELKYTLQQRTVMDADKKQVKIRVWIKNGEVAK